MQGQLGLAAEFGECDGGEPFDDVIAVLVHGDVGEGSGPFIAQMTLVASPLVPSVNSTMLWASNGLRKSSLIASLDGGDASMISMRPCPTLLLPSHA